MTNAAPAAPPPVKLVQFKINGRPMQVPAGTSIIQAAHAAGIDVPYFCYHPGLTPAGNCRMCLVEVSNSKKPVAACVTPVAENVEVLTDSPGARKAREGVLELMLVNHPLDCPICDKSGECMLQDHTYDHGPDHSRMIEPKVLKATKDLGSKITIWGNRCIVCTRCVRFCDEVAGTGELCVVERGDHSVVDVFPNYPIENPLAMNTVDLCPVGALISKDFLYQARVWNMRRQSSICAGCARGCNIEIQTIRNEIKRLMPRFQPEINSYWMCDYGRFDYKYIGTEDRQLRYRLVGSSGAVSANPAGIGANFALRLKNIADQHGREAVVGIASAFMTLEELYLFRRLFEQLGSSRLAALARPMAAEERFKKFTISGDKNPNRAGVELVLGKGRFEGALKEIKDGMRQGKIRAALVIADLPHQSLDEELAQLLGKLEFAAVFLLQQDPRLAGSVSIMPATTFAEKTGVMINEDGRLQRLQTAVQPPRRVRCEGEIFQEILVALGERDRIHSPAAVFQQMGEQGVPELRGLSHREIGDQGLVLKK
ncbi:MAG: (2Fe-2S)-binding protein [Planctomycetes bacterium]|nr:(2Fe-2S)-binding protein [Planctomycetota bacterium]